MWLRTTNVIESRKHIISQLGWASFFLLFLFCFSVWILHVCRFRSLWERSQRKLVKQTAKDCLCCVALQARWGVLRSDHRLAVGTCRTQALGWINVVTLHRLIPVCPGLSCNSIGVALGLVFHLSENAFSSKFYTRRSWRENQISDCWTCWSLKSSLANTAEGLPASRIVSASLQHRCGAKDLACCFLLQDLCNAVSITGTHLNWHLLASVWVPLTWRFWTERLCLALLAAMVTWNFYWRAILKVKWATPHLPWARRDALPWRERKLA